MHPDSFNILQDNITYTMCWLIIVCQFGVHLFVEELFNQTLSVRYFTKIHSCISLILSVKKADTMCYLFYLVDYGYIWELIIDLRKSCWTVINQTLCVSYLAKDTFRLSHDFTGQHSRHYMLASSSFVCLGYTWSWNSYLSRH